MEDDMNVKIIKTNLHFIYRRKHGIYVFPTVLSFFLCVCMCVMCTNVCMNIHIFGCVGTCVYAVPRLVLGFFFALSATFFFETGSLIQIQRSKRITILSLDSLLQVSYLFVIRLEYRWAAMPTWHLQKFCVSELLLAV